MRRIVFVCSASLQFRFQFLPSFSLLTPDASRPSSVNELNYNWIEQMECSGSYSQWTDLLARGKVSKSSRAHYCWMGLFSLRGPSPSFPNKKKETFDVEARSGSVSNSRVRRSHTLNQDPGQEKRIMKGMNRTIDGIDEAEERFCLVAFDASDLWCN